MRPPSYYTSLANSNTHNRNSSQQLRSSLSSSGSSSYVTRTHLPFVAQSTLVAHCLTGAGSTTKPYSSTSLLTAPSYSHSRYASSYTRPQSTNRRHTPSISSSGSSYLSSSTSFYSPSSSSYLSSSSGGGSSISSSSYRPSSNYYKPIRLRERPLLTHLSRQLESPSTSASQTSRSPSTRLHSALSSRPTGHQDSAQVVRPPVESEESWQSDVARNISRNKYLIKFREFDKRPSIAATDVTLKSEQKLEPELVEAKLEAKLETKVENRASESCQVQAELQQVMKLPAPKLEPFEQTRPAEPASEEQPLKVVLSPVNCDTELEQPEAEEKKKPTKEKRNIKLRIKTRNTAATADEVSASNSTPKVKQAKKGSPKVQQDEQSQGPVIEAGNAKGGKVKRAAKGAKSSQTKAVESATSEEKQVASTEATGDEREAKSGKTRKVLGLKQLEAGDETVGKTREPAKVEATKEVKESEPAVGSPSAAVANKRIRFRNYHIEDFNFLSVLGHGGWGFVILAELKEHDACFAVKCIKKITIVEDDDFDSIMIERKVLSLGNVQPFICKLFCTFETPGYLFFAMEYCAGGDLMFHVQREGKFTESRCRFYAAEIICAIRFLHNRHIIYRDLKLDNILLDSSGHIRLVDFGMCQCRTYREEMLPSNFCGTPEYISPEIIKGVPYNHSVDWWSFGVLLYEMAVGKMPFRGNDENELLWNVCYEQIHYPMFLTRELSTLLQLLLEREPTKRLGMATCKAGDIYDQPWFRGVDWRAMEEMRVNPPFVPEVTSKRDVQNFDADFTESAPQLSPVDEATLGRIDQKQFQQFPYTNPDISIFD